MSAQATVRCNKTTIQDALCGDPTLILSKVYEKSLITHREYVNLKSSNRVNVEEQMVELVDKVINKGNETCQSFLNLLQTDEDVRSTYPTLQRIQLIEPVTKPPQAYSDSHPPAHKRQKEDEQYQLNSEPVCLCLIINENVMCGILRSGSTKDAHMLQNSQGCFCKAMSCLPQNKTNFLQKLCAGVSRRIAAVLKAMSGHTKPA